MKIRIFFIAVLFLSVSCRQDKTSPAPGTKDSTAVVTQEGAASVPDSLAIANSLHGFFTWYDAHVEKLSWMRFVDDSGPHLKLIEPKLKEYLSDLKASGFISDDLLEEEMTFYKACEKVWAHEVKDEVPTGLEANRFQCAQDFIAPYPSGEVTSVVDGDRANAVLTLTGELGEKATFRFMMKKEQGKWLLSGLGCPTGLP